MKQKLVAHTAEVAARLKMTREALGMSQADICRRTGIPTNAWNNAETGDNRIGLDNALKLVRATGVSLDWIYQGYRGHLPSDIAEQISKMLAEAPPEGPHRRQTTR